MNRRDFLRYGVSCLMGILLGEGGNLLEASPCRQPMIYKRFFQFTDYERRQATEYLVIHHTGFPGADKDSTAAGIHKFHQGTNQWAGIGYHYLIRKDGTIEQGRQPEMVGAHSYEHNKTSIGICLAGNFNLGKPTEEQMASVKELCWWLCQKYGLDPLKKGVIVGHRDLNDTECPGKNLYKKLGEIRRFCFDRTNP